MESEIDLYMPDYKFPIYTVHTQIDTIKNIVQKYKWKNEENQKSYISYHEHGTFNFHREYIKKSDLDAFFNDVLNLNKLFYSKNSGSNTQSGIFVYTKIPI